MKHFDKLKLLAAVVMTLLPLAALALPFVPTLDPTSPNNYWYYLKTNGYYCVASSYSNDIQFVYSVSSSNDNHLWCFVGDENSGYKVYNKGLGRYLQAEGLYDQDVYDYTYYQDKDGDNFYLHFYDSYTNTDNYLYQRTYGDQYGSYNYMEYSTQTKGVFSVELAKEGVPLPADPQWTRYDADGVGYGYLDGGGGFNASESSNNLCDHNAWSKFYGRVQNCWFTMKSSTSVAVKQYTIVTANDSWGQFQRTLRSWKLQGSNDYYTWVDIDVKTDYPFPFADQKEVVFQVNDTRKFRFFKFMATDGSEVQLSEVWINEQNHTWPNEYTVITEPSCGMPGLLVHECQDCHVRKWTDIPAHGTHSFSEGVCTVCGIDEGETVLLHNGQWAPYFIKGYRGTRADSAGVTYWSQPPLGWNQSANFDDSQWIDLPMPIASPGHSGGALTSLRYNSYWYGEYNSYFFRRVFSLPEVRPNETFTFRCVHDDNMVVYVNGSEVINAQGWTEAPDGSTWLDAREVFKIPASYFKEGENILAVYVQQNWGGAYFDCELTVSPLGGVKGDVTGDGVVDVADVNSIINIMLGKLDKTPSADVTGDGVVDVADANAVINLMLGKRLI